jgi:hypothetical protein
MLQFNQPRQFSLPEVQTLFRTLFTHLEASEVYDTEGIFRIPGTHESIVQITEDILQGKPFIREEYKVHDYIGALKYSLMNCVFNQDDKLLIALKSNIENGDQTEDIEAIKFFVKALVNSNERTKYAAGEVIYDYLHFLTRVAEFAVKNHMDEENLGKMAGPLFANLIDENPKTLLGTIKIANELCTRIIREKHFKMPFKDTFRAQFEKWRAVQIADLETERLELEKLEMRYQLRLKSDYDDLVKDQSELHERNKKPFHTLSTKTKKLKDLAVNKQKDLQILIDEEKANSTRLKQVNMILETLRQELLAEPAKVLRFSIEKAEGAPAAPLNLQKKKREQKVKLAK